MSPYRAPWWSDRRNIVELIHWLIEVGEVRSAADAAYVVEKPHKFTGDWELMEAEKIEALHRAEASA